MQGSQAGGRSPALLTIRAIASPQRSFVLLNVRVHCTWEQQREPGCSPQKKTFPDACVHSDLNPSSLAWASSLELQGHTFLENNIFLSQTERKTAQEEQRGPSL